MWTKVVRLGFVLGIFSSCSAPGFAAAVKLEWSPNSEPDIKGYKLYYGLSPNNYTTILDVSNRTSFTVENLQERTEYYFALSSYDKSGNESTLCEPINCVLGDHEKPAVMTVSADEQSATIVFNRVLDRSSAENIDNYSIDHGIVIRNVSLLSDRRTVKLSTTPHQSDVDYALRIRNIKDIALPANIIAENTIYTYMIGGSDGDSTPPTITLAYLVSQDQLNIFFSEPLDSVSATNLNNYFIDNNIEVKNAALSKDGRIVHLTTSDHTVDLNFAIRINNIRDRSSRKNPMLPNSYYTYSYDPGDITGPRITLVNVIDVDQMEVLFNEALESNTAEDVDNYRIDDGIQVLGAELDPSGQVVRLRTTNHDPDRIYLIKVSGVRDNSVNENPIAEGSSYAYIFVPVDHIGPTINKVIVENSTHLKVVLNEIIDRTSAENKSNYQINNGISIIDASLDVTGKVVQLETSPHSQGQIYILMVSEVLDATSVGNEILPNTSYTYLYGNAVQGTGPTIVEVNAVNTTTLVIEFSEPVEPSGALSLSNYSLSRGAAVLSAQLDETGTKATLATSPHEADRVYILTVNNITDTSPQRNTILPNSAYSYVFGGDDNVGPIITIMKVNDAEHLDIYFNERIAREEAERVSNYMLNGNVTVKAAQLDQSNRIVHLNTTAHLPQKLYVLRINGIVDTSPQKNPVLPNSSYMYMYEPSDIVAPTIAMVQVKDIDRLEVVFNEALNKDTAFLARNYLLNYGAEIKKASAGIASNRVELETTDLQNGKIYILMVNNVQDLAENTIAANSSYAFTYGDLNIEAQPTVTEVQAFSDTELQVTFSSRVNKEKAEDVRHYSIQGGVQIIDARLDASATKVRLQTTKHESERIYVLTVTNICRADRPDLVVRPNTPYFYMMNAGREDAPVLKKVEISGETMLEVTFSSQVNRLSAENRRNYHISGNINVLSARLDETGTKVLLETSRHSAGLVYTLSVYGMGSAAGYSSVITSSIAYTYMPNLSVVVEGYAETLISFVDVGKLYYVDRNYVITQFPDEFYRSKMIMTANNDKAGTETHFLTLQLSQAAFVYVAYDSRAVSVPNWLEARFRPTNLSLGVSENSEKLILWKAFLPAGKVVLGGNNASGARGAKSMYIVLIQEPSFANTIGGGQLESNYGEYEKLPETVNLHTNYPNPFNPVTHIDFEIPYDQHVQLIIYNIIGQRVKTLYQARAKAGRHTVRWDGTNDQGASIATGIYIYRLETWENATRGGLAYRGNYTSITHKMTYIK